MLCRYRRAGGTFERREGLSGDVTLLFEQLLRPHTAEVPAALGKLP